MRVVLDSNILVRSFVSSGGLARDLLLATFAGVHTLILSNEMLVEVARVLRYPRLMAAHGKNEETIYDFTGWLRQAADMVTIDPFMRAPIRDRNDVIVMCTAVSGEADALCSADRDFFEPPASIFLASYGIDLLTDVELMRKLKK